MKRAIEYVGMMLGFWKLKVISSIENTRNWPIWHA
jgi:hypothetical protein